MDDDAWAWEHHPTIDDDLPAPPDPDPGWEPGPPGWEPESTDWPDEDDIRAWDCPGPDVDTGLRGDTGPL